MKKALAKKLLGALTVAGLCSSVAAAGLDTDNDGILDDQENLLGYNPAVPTRIIYVDATRPDDSGDGRTQATAKRSIKAGVNAAKVANYENVVLVKPGTYSGSNNTAIDFGAFNIKLRSTDGPNLTKVEIPASSYFITIQTIPNAADSWCEGFTITTNNLSSSNGLIRINNAGIALKNNVFRDIQYSFGGGTIHAENPTGMIIDQCVFTNVHLVASYPGGGMGSGAIYVKTGSATINNSTFSNISGHSGSVLHLVGVANSPPTPVSITVNRCRFIDNKASNHGGVLYLGSATNLTLNNCLAYNNRSIQGGAFLYSDGSSGSVALNHCTIFNNSTVTGSDINAGSQFSMDNSIFLGTLSGTPGSIDNSLTSFSSSSHGSGNLSGNPMLLPSGWLSSDSPCIDAAGATTALDVDFAGQIRPQGAAADIGCFEFLDSDSDGIPDAVEIIAGMNPYSAADAVGDADNDGLNNLEEFQNGTDPGNSDSDSDGIADKVEVDSGFNPLKYTKTLYVDASRPNDSGNGMTLATAKKSINAAVTALGNSGYENVILVEAGTYTGTNNRNLSFNGTDIKLLSLDGAATTVINLENAGRFLTLEDGESLATVIGGFTFINGYSTTFGTVMNITSSQATILNCVFDGNKAGTPGVNNPMGGYSTSVISASGKPVIIENCEFNNNASFFTTSPNAGALYLANGAHTTIKNSRFKANSGHYGGAIYATGTQVNIQNSIFSDNSSNTGSAVYFDSTSSGGAPNLFMLNSMLRNNTSASGYSDIYLSSYATAEIMNSTIFGGTAQPGSMRLNGNTTITNSIVRGIATIGSGAQINASYNCTQNNWAAYGTNNITSDPMLTAAGFLKAGSPCIDSGTNVGIPDIYGVARPQNSTADIGCMEFKDSDGDGIPDYFETLLGTDPANPNDAATDPDGDGKSYLAEYHGNTVIDGGGSGGETGGGTGGEPGGGTGSGEIIDGKRYMPAYKASAGGSQCFMNANFGYAGIVGHYTSNDFSEKLVVAQGTEITFRFNPTPGTQCFDEVLNNEGKYFEVYDFPYYYSHVPLYIGPNGTENFYSYPTTDARIQTVKCTDIKTYNATISYSCAHPAPPYISHYFTTNTLQNLMPLCQ